jgi:Family of unknown function (DUF6152)
MRVARTFCTAAMALCAPLFLARAAAAHHGSTSYRTDQVIVLKQAAVTQFLWANPHSMLLFDVKDDKGNVAHWAAEAGSPAAIRAHGWNKYSVRPGDVIRVQVYPSKFEADVGRVDTIVLPDGTTLRNAPRTDRGDISRY